MKPFGFGLIILMAAFILGAYALFVPWEITQRGQGGLNNLGDFFNSLYDALRLGLVALIVGAIGTLVFFVEFKRHEPAAHVAPHGSTFSSNLRSPVSPTQQSPRFCRFCGEELAQGEYACRKCGTVVSS